MTVISGAARINAMMLIKISNSRLTACVPFTTASHMQRLKRMAKRILRRPSRLCALRMRRTWGSSETDVFFITQEL